MSGANKRVPRDQPPFPHSSFPPENWGGEIIREAKRKKERIRKMRKGSVPVPPPSLNPYHRRYLGHSTFTLMKSFDNLEIVGLPGSVVATYTLLPIKTSMTGKLAL